MSDTDQQPTEQHRSTEKLWISFSLPAALGVAIVAAGLIVAVAYNLYWHDNNRKYDIARPGQAANNDALNVDDEDTDTLSPVDAPATQRKSDFLNKEVNALEGLNKFNPSDLNDENIQLVPSDQPSF